ncbi:acyl-CoA dehydrogenase family protein [Flexibacterium corallicola]|uniref:acyl-CoA dehydrogenase family protein n=1 Tax=Flexibacterium corallicola TaxID=3037259 RepID=UPI00286EBDC7|nr:acyl-CoA dehydrogenase family protein [Pseudovibrio sp. M1P-2-3]
MTDPVQNQSPPFAGYNLASHDRQLCSIRALYGLENTPDGSFFQYGKRCGAAESLALGRLANENKPQLKTHDPYGRRLDQVEFHPSYHALMRRSFDVGLHCASVEAMDPAAGHVHLERACLFYMMTQVEAGHLCPITMTNAAGFSLADSETLGAEWLPRIKSRKYDQRFLPVNAKQGVTIGMGMTEKQGGTDLRRVITTAEITSEDYYLLNGHKWFFSAPMCDAFLVLARRPAGPTCFLVPRLLETGEVNNLNLMRLKNKLGNHSNASSEVEFVDAAGWLLGEEGKGIQRILKMVTPTRIDCALASAALMRASLMRAVHHTRYRSVFGQHLIEQPLMQRVLADMALDVAAATALAMRLAYALQLCNEDESEAAFLRIMTPAAKYWICKVAGAVTGEAMECLGGNGYVEDFDQARIYRESPVNAIWEGSGNVMALDVLRVLNKNPDVFESFCNLLKAALGPSGEVSIDVLKSAAESAQQDPGNARILTEQLAITGAAAALKQSVPAEISDAFMETRLAGQWRSTYGMLEQRYNAKDIIDWLYPPL